MPAHTPNASNASNVRNTRNARNTTSPPHTPVSKPWFPPVFGVILVLIGLVLLFGGFRLLSLGGSWYYALSGLPTIVAGILLVQRRSAGGLVYLLVVVATLIWAFAETGGFFWGLVPRLAGVLVLGTIAALCMRALAPSRRGLGGAAALIQVVLLVAGAVMMFFPHGAIHNTADAGTKPVNSVPAVTDANSPANSWKYYGRDADSARFAPFEQINAGNVSQLEVAWTYHTGTVPGPGIEDQNTPIQVGDSLFLCTPTNKAIALDAETGKEKWAFDPKTDENKTWSRCRGVAYYEMPAAQKAPDGKCDTRIILTDKMARMWALDAKTGAVCEGFGDTKQGYTDLSKGMGPYPEFFYMPTSQPLVAGDRVVIGGWVWDGKKTEEPSGVVRAFSLQTGEFEWAWDLAKPDFAGVPPDGQAYTRGTPNYWSSGAYDPKLDLIYLPLGNATPDFWAEHRTPAMNEYGSTIVALKGDTGRAAWHFQTTHIDTWDYDVGAPPTLADLPDGRGGKVPAVIVGTKTHQLYVLDRSNGTPIAEVKETPVPQAFEPGDAKPSPTQPLSVGMPDVAPMRMAEKNMWGATVFDQLYCRIKFRQMHYEGPFTKLSTRPTLIYPGYYGGYNWGGMAFDPRTNVLVVNDMRMPQYGFLSPQAEAPARLEALKKEDMTNASWATHVQEGTPFQSIRGAFNSFLGLPCSEPSWGNLTAIDMNTRKIAWQVPLGTVKDSAIKGIPFGLPLPLGMPSLAGPFATAGGLTFYAGTQDYYLRAFDNRSGKEVWKARLPVGAQATPMTYLSPASGRQFVVISAGGARMTPDRGDYVIAYALPKK